MKPYLTIGERESLSKKVNLTPTQVQHMYIHIAQMQVQISQNCFLAGFLLICLWLILSRLTDESSLFNLFETGTLAVRYDGPCAKVTCDLNDELSNL